MLLWTVSVADSRKSSIHSFKRLSIYSIDVKKSFLRSFILKKRVFLFFKRFFYFLVANFVILLNPLNAEIKLL